jgi:hypothetical protein
MVHILKLRMKTSLQFRVRDKIRDLGHGYPRKIERLDCKASKLALTAREYDETALGSGRSCRLDMIRLRTVQPQGGVLVFDARPIGFSAGFSAGAIRRSAARDIRFWGPNNSTSAASAHPGCGYRKSAYRSLPSKKRCNLAFLAPCLVN